MTTYIIIEIDNGFTVAEVPDDSTPEEVAKDTGGILIDAGPYHTYQQAEDVLLTLPNPYERDETS